MNDKLIICFETMKTHVDAAQKTMGTDIPVTVLQEDFRADPKALASVAKDAVEHISKDIETILFATAWCGGVLEGITLPADCVFPDVQDTASMLMITDDARHWSKAEPYHMYFKDSDVKDRSVRAMLKDIQAQFGTEPGLAVFGMMVEDFVSCDIIETGAYDCYDLDFVADVEKSADLMRCPVNFIQGSNIIFEKLVSGRWDGQFVKKKKGEIVTFEDYTSEN